MTDTITLIGIVATPPRHLVTNTGLAITSFRLASTQRRFDRAQEKWVDADTNWYTITAFRHLAYNAAVSLAKGDRVIVEGKIRIRDWQTDERSGTNIDVEADAVGHDLSWGTSRWVKASGGGVSANDRSENENWPAVATAGSTSSDRHDVPEAAESWSTVSVGAVGAVGAVGQASPPSDSSADSESPPDLESSVPAPPSRPGRRDRAAAPTGDARTLNEIPVPF